MSFQDQLEHYAISSLRAEPCPTVANLAAYLSGTLTGMQQLSIAAHVRLCPLCARELALSQAPEVDDRWQVSGDAVAKPRIAIAQLIGQAAFGRMRTRSAATTEGVRQYIAADIAINLTIAPPMHELWRISGYVTQGDAPLAERHVALRSQQKRFREQTDEDGFFTFQDVPPGQYTFSLSESSVSIQIRDLTLRLPT